MTVSLCQKRCMSINLDYTPTPPYPAVIEKINYYASGILVSDYYLANGWWSSLYRKLVARPSSYQRASFSAQKVI